MTDLHERAIAILAQRGVKGTLTELAGDNWLLKGEVGTKGALAQISGRPDEAILDQAASQIRAMIDEDGLGR
jgi:hypothetical protein